MIKKIFIFIVDLFNIYFYSEIICIRLYLFWIGVGRYFDKWRNIFGGKCYKSNE